MTTNLFAISFGICFWFSTTHKITKPISCVVYKNPKHKSVYYIILSADVYASYQRNFVAKTSVKLALNLCVSKGQNQSAKNKILAKQFQIIKTSTEMVRSKMILEMGKCCKTLPLSFRSVRAWDRGLRVETSAPCFWCPRTGLDMEPDLSSFAYLWITFSLEGEAVRGIGRGSAGLWDRKGISGFVG